jgi:multidrug efflux pump subunit AcrA (membrane-fusion protein)
MKKIPLIVGTLLWSATFSYGERLEIYPQIAGEITSIATVNQTVKKGDTLVKFDERQIQMSIEKATAIVTLKKVLLDDAEKILGENKTLFESTVAAKRDVDMAQLEYDKAKALYEIEVANLEYYKLEKEKYTIKAPFNGVVKDIPHHLNVTNLNQPKVLLVIESK